LILSNPGRVDGRKIPSGSDSHFFVEVLQAYSSKGRHYESRLDKILVAKEKTHPPQKPRRCKAKSSAKLIHRLTSDQVNDMTDRYQQGWSSRRPAKVYGVSKTASIFCFEKQASPFAAKALVIPRQTASLNAT
jgi:hypothetical protein